jgi:hypothetical protein
MWLKSENETVPEETQQKKTKRKGKIAQVYKLHRKGIGIKEISEKMNLKETIVRSYIWRRAHPEKYKELLQRYFAKKKQKLENEKIKLAVSNTKEAEKKK